MTKAIVDKWRQVLISWVVGDEGKLLMISRGWR